MTSVRDDVPFADPALAGDDNLEPGARARCVVCGETLIAKCGQINAWHWAHEARSACMGSAGEGAWHRAWKQWAANHGAEVEMTTQPHRADIVWPDGRVFELQSSYLDAGDIRKREEHYGDRMTWIYRFTQGRWDRLWNIGEGWFRWDRGAPSMTMHNRPVMWHHHDRLYRVTLKIDADGRIVIKFAPGEPDKYGPVMYGSDPAPFDVHDAIPALNQFEYDSKAVA